MGFEIRGRTPGPLTSVVSVRFHKRTHRQLRRHAEKNGVPVTETIRQMIDHCLTELDAKSGSESHG